MNINAAIENVQKREHRLMEKFILLVAFLLLTLLLVVVGLILVNEINVPLLLLSTSSSTTSTSSISTMLFPRHELNLCGWGNDGSNGSHPGSIDTLNIPSQRFMFFVSKQLFKTCIALLVRLTGLHGIMCRTPINMDNAAFTFTFDVQLHHPNLTDTTMNRTTNTTAMMDTVPLLLLLMDTLTYGLQKREFNMMALQKWMGHSRNSSSSIVAATAEIALVDTNMLTVEMNGVNVLHSDSAIPLRNLGVMNFGLGINHGTLDVYLAHENYLLA